MPTGQNGFKVGLTSTQRSLLCACAPQTRRMLAAEKGACTNKQREAAARSSMIRAGARMQPFHW